VHIGKYIKKPWTRGTLLLDILNRDSLFTHLKPYYVEEKENNIMIDRNYFNSMTDGFITIGS
jgi:hypothetical protein